MQNDLKQLFLQHLDRLLSICPSKQRHRSDLFSAPMQSSVRTHVRTHNRSMSYENKYTQYKKLKKLWKIIYWEMIMIIVLSRAQKYFKNISVYIYITDVCWYEEEGPSPQSLDAYCWLYYQTWYISEVLNTFHVSLLFVLLVLYSGL